MQNLSIDLVGVPQGIRASIAALRAPKQTAQKIVYIFLQCSSIGLRKPDDAPPRGAGNKADCIFASKVTAKARDSVGASGRIQRSFEPMSGYSGHYGEERA